MEEKRREILARLELEEEEQEQDREARLQENKDR